MGRRIAIGDIHGCLNTFVSLTFDLLRITKKDKIILLGDYIDRGPYSKQTLDFIMHLIKEGYDITPIIGNHEALVLDVIKNKAPNSSWLCDGAFATLKSFGVAQPELIPHQYFRFIETMPYFVEFDDYVLTHAGLNFNIDDPLSDKDAMLWTRSEFTEPAKIENKKLIVGHTPTNLDKVRESLAGDVFKLDGGCVYKYIYKSLGNLLALDLDTLELFVCPNIDV